MKVNTRLLLLALAAVLAFGPCAGAGAQHKKFTIVIDPGHGGDHPGAVRAGVREKDLNLAIATRLGALITEGCPDVKVIYTRTGDTNPSLAERGALANRSGADLFFSIHINAHTGTAANGTSTWVMGTSKNDANLREAMRENEVIRYEDGYREHYEGFDPSSAESYIVFQLMQYAHFDRSLQLAAIVQRHYAHNTPMKDRGAAQGPFLVLWKTTMPSILTEVGFITNDSDRRYITSSEGQATIARALYDAFREYKALTEEGSMTTAASSTPTNVAPAADTATTPASAPEQIASTGAVAPSDGGFFIQLAASRTKISTSDGVWGAFRGQVVEHSAGVWWKYSLGPYSTRDEAAKKLAEVRKTKFREAFIIKID